MSPTRLVRRAILLLMVVTAAVLGYAGAALADTPSGTLDAHSLPASAQLGWDPGIQNWVSHGQQFQAINSGKVTSVQVGLSRYTGDGGTGDGDLKVQITTTDESGLPTNNVLAEATLPPGTVTPEYPDKAGELITANFCSPPEVVAGQKYAIVLRTPNGHFVWNNSTLDGWHASLYAGIGYWEFYRTTTTYAVYLNGQTAPDTAAPCVTNTVPSNGATGVSRATTVKATFSERMDPATLSPATVKLFSGRSTKPLKATVSYDDSTQTVTLTPSQRLEETKTSYRAVVTTGAKDLAGNALDQDPNLTGNQHKEWAFVTGVR